jgi:hypothetical protein
VIVAIADLGWRSDLGLDQYADRVQRVRSRQARGAASERETQRATEERWEDFADHMLEIAREIQFRGFASPEAVSLTPSEGIVMRYLFPHPVALPSQVASATGLQGSNLSAVLRGWRRRG